MRTHSQRNVPAILVLSLFTVALSAGACSRTATPATMPPAEEIAQVPTMARVTARLIPHPVAGQEACSLCHGEGDLLPLPADHADRSDDTCLACHDVEPALAQVAGGSAAEKGQTTWQQRSGLSCRDCHGMLAEGGFGPALAQSSLDFATFRQRTRTPLSDRMPPVATALDDPAFEKGGTWISDEDLKLVHAWLTGEEPGPSEEPSQEEVAPFIPHALQGQEDCLLCHSAEGAMPIPEDHEGWGNDICLTCHTQEGSK